MTVCTGVSSLLIARSFREESIRNRKGKNSDVHEQNEQNWGEKKKSLEITIYHASSQTHVNCSPQS